MVQADQRHIPSLAATLVEALAATKEERRLSRSKGRLYVFSDSLFLAYAESSPKMRAQALYRCVGELHRILELFASYKLPLRGGVAFGDFILGRDLLIGEAVLRAVLYERLAFAPVVLLPERELLRADCNTSRLKKRPRLLPVRDNGLIRARVIFPHGKAEFSRFVEAERDRAAMHGPFDVARAWQLAAELLRDEQE